MLARLSANATWVRQIGQLPSSLGIEVLAQAAICLLPDLLEGGGRGLLAGVDEAVFQGELDSGQTWLCLVEVRGRFGKLVKVQAALVREADGFRLIEAQLLLARTD